LKTRQGYDMKLFLITFLLVALGLIMVFSASQVIGKEQFSSSFFFIQRHAIRVALGICCMLVCMKIPFGFYRKMSLYILILSIILLSAIFIWGREVRGAVRWLQVFNFVIQPVEVAKYALIIFLSARIADGKEKITDLKRGFLPLLGVVIMMATLIGFQPNLSNAVMIVLISMAMMFIGGCRIRHIASFGAAVAAVGLPLMYSFPHVRERFMVLCDRGADLQGQGWQVNQSLIALGSGFIFGCGPGNGHQKYNFLPDAHTDFIYSIIGEELGIIGTVSVLFLFVVLFNRALRTAKRAPNSFGFLLAMGIGLSIFSTAIINISMTLGIVPVAGLPLPFVSYGGSSLITSMSAVGILLSISSKGRNPGGPKRHLTADAGEQVVYARRSREKETVW